MSFVVGDPASECVVDVSIRRSIDMELNGADNWYVLRVSAASAEDLANRKAEALVCRPFRRFLEWERSQSTQGRHMIHCLTYRLPGGRSYSIPIAYFTTKIRRTE